ncbi:MAG: acyltransferase, partial [Oscillospiraceae bacterium]|nr:acyltransferase [Oscillospiraceae bacterium]
NGLDRLKLICAFFVVTIHVVEKNLTYGLHSQFLIVTRVAVPIFFIITGWFYHSTVAKNRETKQILKIVKLFFVGLLICLIWETLKSFVSGGLADFLKQFTDPATYIDFLLFNVIRNSAGPLWYLAALIYVLVAAYIFRRVIKSPKIKTLLIILAISIPLSANFVLGEFSFLTPLSLPTFYTRNFLLTGMPMFLIGVFLFKHRNSVKKIPIQLLIAVLITSFVISQAEVIIADFHNFYVSTVISATVLFIIFNRLNLSDNPFSAAGRKHSLNIYIIHNVIIHIYIVIITAMGINGVFPYYLPILIFAASLVISIIFENVKGRVIAFSKSKKST